VVFSGFSKLPSCESNKLQLAINFFLKLFKIAYLFYCCNSWKKKKHNNSWKSWKDSI